MKDIISSFLDRYDLRGKRLAVGVSGGADSMCLAWGLAHMGGKLDLFTVDHNLRDAAKNEAMQVANWFKDFPNVTHHILSWDHDGVDSRVQEAARNARYDLMFAKCRALQIGTLFVAHHRDDQAETFLSRLSKGSGLDGLCGMEQMGRRDGIQLARPFLSVSHDEIIDFCRENKINWIEDPSNENEGFERVRLRKSREILENEGLSNKRLAKTSSRLDRAKQALVFYTDQIWDQSVSHASQNFEIDLSVFRNVPDEIAVRVLIRVFKLSNPDKTYAPRMEKIEDLLMAICNKQDMMKARTLGGCKFSLTQTHLVIQPE